MLHAAASCRFHSFLLIDYFLLLGEQAHSVLNGVYSPAHYCKHEKQAYHDDGDDNVGLCHDDWLCVGTELGSRD